MDRITRLLTGTLAVALTACADAARAPQSASSVPLRPVDEVTHAPTPATSTPEGWAPESPLPGLVLLDRWAMRDTAVHGARADSSDDGVGFAGFGSDVPLDTARGGHRGVLYLRQEPRADALPVAAMVLASYTTASDLGQWLFGPAGVRPNTVEYDMDHHGVPVDSFANGWARGIVGWDAAGARVHGWVEVSDTGRVRVGRWAGILAGQSVVFVSDSVAPVYGSLADTLAAGRPLSAILRGDDYTMETLETHGRWMRVRLAHPNALCGDAGVDSTKPMRSREVWIQYVDRRGRPLVWWPVRGC